MIRILCALVLAAASYGPMDVLAASSKLPAALKSADEVVWAGLDYSLVRMVGPGDFNDPSAIFPEMLEAWNSLFLREMMRKTEAAVGKPLAPDIGGVTARNGSASEGQIVANAGPNDGTAKTHISPEILAEAIRGYQLESDRGVGLVFVVDRLVKPEKQGAVYVVFFDIAAREILASERKVYKAAGFGFRNYWFRVPKNAVNDLKRIVKQQSARAR